MSTTVNVQCAVYHSEVCVVVTAGETSHHTVHSIWVAFVALWQTFWRWASSVLLVMPVGRGTLCLVDHLHSQKSGCQIGILRPCVIKTPRCNDTPSASKLLEHCTPMQQPPTCIATSAVYLSWQQQRLLRDVHS
ncbi:hypothetical protein CEXT_525811 [Caerostris extrusa]|uniref:Uncharacterized protein n=1 Tax=Caerostris extrusa TaxID=172846 RepID=A0AAV4PFN6_CAEEX|nr:hypothetical protein CEXT_525811 [Caerostris extrusa]